jgi:hypothetical protein
MSIEIAGTTAGISGGFRRVIDVFLAGAGLPFSRILSGERIERICGQHGCLFGQHGIFSTPVVLWAFLSQVLRDGKEAACQAAVASIAAMRLERGEEPPTEDTGDYCRARAKLAPQALKAISCEVAEEVEQAADPRWLWKGTHHAKLVDGFTFTMPDTPANQDQYPQAKTQQPGIGLPIARATPIMSLATGAIMNLACGPYQGKETGETARLRSMLDSFKVGDVIVMDRYFCSFMMLAMLHGRGAHVCTRQHQRRSSDLRQGRRLGQHDRLMTWTRPACPAWMKPTEYAAIPETLEVRVTRFTIREPGRRTREIEVVTTLTDAETYSRDDIAELYGFRWNTELDIRSLKSTLNLDHLRCKTPRMVLAEVWATILAYNLIRTTAARAAALHDKQPRQISFTSACQHILAGWMLLSASRTPAATLRELRLRLLEQIASCEVANRPGRFEPRVIKRRKHRYPLMNKPRAELRRRLATSTA